MKKSIKGRLILVIILIMAVPLAVLGTVSYFTSVSAIYSTYTNSNTQLANELSSSIENYLKTFETASKVYANSVHVKNITNISKSDAIYDDIMASFQSYVDENDDVLYIYLGTKNKRMIDPSWPEVTIDEYDPTSRDWYIDAAEKGATIWTDPYIDEQSKLMVVSVATPVFDKNNNLIGVVAVDISLDKLSQKMNAITVGNTGYPRLIDQDSNVMTHKNPKSIGQAIDSEIVNNELQNKKYETFDFEENGVDKLGSLSVIELTNWHILAAMDKSDFTQLTAPILYTTIALVSICLIVGIAIALLITRSITRPITSLEKTMSIVSSGDLTVLSKVKSKDEFGRMSESFNTMIKSFSKMLEHSKKVTDHVSESARVLSSNADVVNISSGEIAETIEEIAQGATEQALETEKGVVLIDKLSTKINELNESSFEMAEIADEVSIANEKGTAVMTDLKVKTADNNIATEKIAKAIKALEDKSSEIGSILETITGIAEQTNLLALNASIEAARAGEQGKGFAVVAEEIRKLAEGSSEAADDIKVIVSQIQNESSNAVLIMGEVQIRTSDQSVAVDSVEEVFKNVSASTKKITSLIVATSSFVKSMNHEKDKIVESIQNISSVSEESAAAAEQVTASVIQQGSSIEEVAASAKILNSMAEELKDEINKFKV